MKKVGIITFHNSYNCGSMLESFAIEKILEKQGLDAKIIDFQSLEQKELYNIKFKNNSIRNIVKNIIIIPARKKLKNNNARYEAFKNKNFKLTKTYTKMEELNDKDFDVVVAGSDQVWNITIEDGNDAYFLPWVKNAKKVAYAPSFGAKNIMEHTSDTEKYKNFINDFDAISIRENNGQKWIKDLCDIDVPVLVDPTLLLEAEDYDLIKDDIITPKNEDYIFLYCPGFDREICKFVKKISEKYNLKVITWSTKSYYTKNIKSFGFELVECEDPAIYLSLIKNAKLVMTTSYHGTIFSTIYKKNFITIKNGGMYGSDDRVRTLLDQLDMNETLIPFEFDDNFDYLRDVNYKGYDEKMKKLKEKALTYINENICK